MITIGTREQREFKLVIHGFNQIAITIEVETQIADTGEWIVCEWIKTGERIRFIHAFENQGTGTIKIGRKRFGKINIKSAGMPSRRVALLACDRSIKGVGV